VFVDAAVIGVIGRSQYVGANIPEGEPFLATSGIPGGSWGYLEAGETCFFKLATALESAEIERLGHRVTQRVYPPGCKDAAVVRAMRSSVFRPTVENREVVPVEESTEEYVFSYLPSADVNCPRADWATPQAWSRKNRFPDIEADLLDAGAGT
jgi:hypothetical protein